MIKKFLKAILFFVAAMFALALLSSLWHSATDTPEEAAARDARIQKSIEQDAARDAQYEKAAAERKIRGEMKDLAEELMECSGYYMQLTNHYSDYLPADMRMAMINATPVMMAVSTKLDPEQLNERYAKSDIQDGAISADSVMQMVKEDPSKAQWAAATVKNEIQQCIAHTNKASEYKQFVK